MSKPSPYVYEATVVRVIDGDTLVMDVNLGFDVHLAQQSFRLFGVNAREKSDAGGQEAKDNLSQLLPPGSPVQLESVKNDKFGGRYDAVITLSGGLDLADLLVRSQWAAAWNGQGVKPVPPWPRTVTTLGS